MIVWITIGCVLSSVFIKNFIKCKLSSTIFILLFEIFVFVICFPLLLCVYFLSLFLSNLSSTYRKNLRKGRYQTSDLLLSLVITMEAVVFTYSNQKILIFCNLAIFFFKILYFFSDLSFLYWNDIILLAHNFNSLDQFSLSCMKLWTFV